MQLRGKGPGERTTLYGEPIAYSVTIPRAAPRPRLAEAYVDLLLSPAGQAVLRRTGQEPLSPARGSGEVPAALRPRLRPAAPP